MSTMAVPFLGRIRAAMASNMSRVLSSAAASHVSANKLALRLARSLPGAGSSSAARSAIRLFSSPSTDQPHEESPSKEPEDGGGVKVTESKDSQSESDDDDVGEFVNEKTGEIGGPRGPEPSRYGDWEQKGRCSDF